MWKAIHDGPNCRNVFVFLQNVNDVIFYEGVHLKEKGKQALKKEFINYINNIMFQEDVEYVVEDCYGNLYESLIGIPHNVLHRFGFRWKATKRMLVVNSWYMTNQFGKLENIKAERIIPELLPPEPVEAREKSYMKQDYFLLNE